MIVAQKACWRQAFEQWSNAEEGQKRQYSLWHFNDVSVTSQRRLSYISVSSQWQLISISVDSELINWLRSRPSYVKNWPSCKLSETKNRTLRNEKSLKFFACWYFGNIKSRAINRISPHHIHWKFLSLLVFEVKLLKYRFLVLYWLYFMLFLFNPCWTNYYYIT